MYLNTKKTLKIFITILIIWFILVALESNSMFYLKGKVLTFKLKIFTNALKKRMNGEKF